MEYDHCPVVISSAYSLVLGRSVPLRVTVLFGQSQLHYEEHFRRLFADLDCALVDTIVEETTAVDLTTRSGATGSGFAEEVKQTKICELKWKGSSMDFSDAQRLAHDVCLREALMLQNPDRWTNPSMGFKLAAEVTANSIRGCQVHFKRCVHRLSRTARQIPPDRSSEFELMANTVCDVQPEELEDKVRSLVSGFPGSWFLQPGRRELIFVNKPAVLANSRAWSKIDRTNNRGESMCAIFRRFAPPGQKLQLADGVDSIIRVLRIFEAEFKAESVGMATRYGLPRSVASKARRRGRQYRNDGRPGTSKRSKNSSDAAGAKKSKNHRVLKLAAAAANSLRGGTLTAGGVSRASEPAPVAAAAQSKRGSTSLPRAVLPAGGAARVSVTAPAASVVHTPVCLI